MNTRNTWRRTLAVPTTIALALGATLIGTSAAHAVPSELVVTSPVEGATAETRTVVVEGTAIADANVIIKENDDTGDTLATTTTDETGAFSVPVDYPAEAPVAQTIFITGDLDGDVFEPTVTRSFLLPAVAPVEPVEQLTLVSPAEGATTESRSVLFAGTAPADSTVVIEDAAGDELGVQGTGTAGAFAIQVDYADDAPVEQTVTVSGVEFDDTLIRSFSLPEAVVAEPIVIDAPVITAPVQGEVVVGDRVTFQGTGTPGTDIGVIALPTAELEQLQAELEAALGQSETEGDFGTFAQPSPQPEPSDPADRVIVGEDGTWSVTITAVPGDYTAVAFSVLMDDAGLPVIDPATGLPVVAGPSGEIEFSIVPAAAPAAVDPARPLAPELAATGADLDAVPFGAAVLLVLAGLTLMAVRRRVEAVRAD